MWERSQVRGTLRLCSFINPFADFICQFIYPNIYMVTETIHSGSLICH